MDITTRLRSRAMRIIASPAFLGMKRNRARLGRRLRGQQPVVHYFHQVDDPYSHLAVQKLDALKAAYSIPFISHLVSLPDADFQGDEQRYSEWAGRDARSIAAFYECTLPGHSSQLDPAAVAAANAVLAGVLTSATFASIAYETGQRLWQAEALAQGQDLANAEQFLSAGNQLRTDLGHYFGAMFYFEGEWFWGVDRLHLLEQRLRDEGHLKHIDTPISVPQPVAEDASDLNASRITLEYFPSLRSPYTVVGHARVTDLVQRSGVTLALKPVLPMMMRGIPAPRAKQQYIMTDAAREARAYGVPFGHFVDPFGEPVKRAFSYFPAALRLGRGLDYVGAYLSATFAEGVDITSEQGLEQVANSAGLDWTELRLEAEEDDWMQVLDANIEAMLGAGLWGVPSFRVTGGGEPAFSCWGQDRIWRVETEITRRAKTLGACQ